MNEIYAAIGIIIALALLRIVDLVKDLRDINKKKK